MNPPGRILAGRPILVSVLYTITGVLPLYGISASSIRLQDELGFGRTQLGLVVAAFYLISSIASKTQGSVVDRIGPTKGLYLGSILSLIASLFIGLLASSWQALAVGTAIAGLSNAYAQLSSNVAVASHVKQTRQGIGFALKQAAVPAGAMLAGLAVPLGSDIAWQWLFIGTAAIAALAILMVPPMAHEPVHRGSQSKLRIGGPLIALTVAAALGGGLGNSLASFVVDAAATSGFSESLAPRLLTVGAVTAIIMRTLSGWSADRRQKRGVAELTSLLVLAVVGLAVLAVAAGDTGSLFIIGVVLSFAGAWGWPGVMYYVVVRSTELPAASATGAVLSGAYLGTVIGPPVMGLIADRASYTLVFGLASGLMVVAVAAVWYSQALYQKEEVVQPS